MREIAWYHPCGGKMNGDMHIEIVDERQNHV